VKPAMRRRAAAHLIESGMRSQRRACQLMGIHPSIYRYKTRPAQDETLRARLKVLAVEYPRYGYPLLHALLKGEGLVINPKRTYRIYREEKLQVRKRRRKRLPARDRVEMTLPAGPNQRWSIDRSMVDGPAVSNSEHRRRLHPGVRRADRGLLHLGRTIGSPIGRSW
jgi:putative transposase